LFSLRKYLRVFVIISFAERKREREQGSTHTGYLVLRGTVIVHYELRHKSHGRRVELVVALNHGNHPNHPLYHGEYCLLLVATNQKHAPHSLFDVCSFLLDLST
jgi:hypothetical protein